MVKCSCGCTYFAIAGRFTLETTAFHCHEHVIACCNCGAVYNIKGEEVDLQKEVENNSSTS